MSLIRVNNCSHRNIYGCMATDIADVSSQMRWYSLSTQHRSNIKLKFNFTDMFFSKLSVLWPPVFIECLSPVCSALITCLTRLIRETNMSVLLKNCKHRDLIFAPGYLPPALYFIFSKILSSIFFKLTNERKQPMQETQHTQQTATRTA